MKTAEFPEDLEFLFKPKRYKITYGGRGGTKSWGYARTLLIIGAAKKLRILCTREVQKSIKDSVHKLLSDQIDLLGLGAYYRVLDHSIKGVNGTEFTFAGLSTQTVESIKSYEGYDIVWVEEAQIVKKRSWDILIPTIRKEGSEIWISFNPRLKSDETYVRFIKNTPPDATVKFLNYRNNPWHNQIMENERRHFKITDPDNYDNIWEGKCLPAVPGAIFYKEVQAAEIENRIRNVPYDPMLKVHIVMDLGWEDSLTAALVQKILSEIRIIEYVEANRTSPDVFSSYLKTRPYNWGKVWLPRADGFSKTFISKGQSAYDIMKRQGWNVATKNEVAHLSVEEGIRITRLKFGQMYFDKEKTAAEVSPKVDMDKLTITDRHWRFIESLKRFKRHINEDTEVVGVPVRDPSKHGGDTVRYVAINADRMTNEDDRKFRSSGVSYRPLDAVIGY